MAEYTDEDYRAIGEALLSMPICPCGCGSFRNADGTWTPGPGVNEDGSLKTDDEYDFEDYF